jgi:CHASE3 domain sensor protein
MNETNNNEGGAGAIFGIVVIIIVLLVGAVYFLGQKTTWPGTGQQASTTQNNAQADDINSLQNDAANMNFDNLGQGVNQLQ